MTAPPPGYPSRRKLLAIGATLAVIATTAGLLAPEDERDGRPAPTPTPSSQGDADRPGP